MLVSIVQRRAGTGKTPVRRDPSTRHAPGTTPFDLDAGRLRGVASSQHTQDRFQEGRDVRADCGPSSRGLRASRAVTRFDAIIIGAGQARPPLAGRLTDAGMSVAFVERG